MVFEKMRAWIQLTLDYVRWLVGLPHSGRLTVEQRKEFVRSAAVAFTFIGVSMLLRCIYVFFFTQYQNYLTSDMGGYWVRALERYNSLADPTHNSDQYSINEWILWPTMYHFILTFTFQIYHALGIDQSRWLQCTLLSNCLLGSISVYYVYLIGKLLFPKSERRAIVVGVLYGLSYPIIFFNCMVMSENLAIPLTIISTYLVFRYPGKFWWMLWAGLLIGIDCGVRPASIPQFILCCAYIVFSQPGLRRKAAVIAFALGCIVPIIGVIHENSRISQGRLHGLSANGGLNFYMIQCNVREIHALFKINGGEYLYVDGMSQFDLEPNHKVVYTDQAFYHQDYYARQAVQSMTHLDTWVRDIKEIPKIFTHDLFPRWYTAAGFDVFDKYFSLWFCEICMVTSLIVPPILWIVYRRRRFPWSQALLWSYIGAVVFQCFLFGSERRYTYLVLFAAFLLIFTLLPTRKRPKSELNSRPTGPPKALAEPVNVGG